MSSISRSLFTVKEFARIGTKRFFRDKLAIFFTILFPLIFLFVFGGIFGSSNDASFDVAVINNSDSEFSRQFIKNGKDSKVLKVDDEIKTLADAKEKMLRSQLDAAIVLPEKFGVIQQGAQYPSGQAEVIYTQNNEQSGRMLQSVLNSMFDGMNKQFVPVERPFSVKATQINENSLSSFDYLFAGMLGFAILGIGIFGPVNVFPELKKMGILRRLSMTPLKVWQYFLSTMISQALVGLVALAVMFGVALTIFKLNVVGNYFEIAIFLVFGIVTLLGIGLAMGGWAKNERQAAPLANIIVFPMMFLSGTFFPRFLMPEWLQHASNWLPLTPIIDGTRLMVTEGKHLVDILPQLGMMAIWVIVIYAIAFKVFRWE